MAYATVAELRALPKVTNPPFTDAEVTDAIEWATLRIDGYCGTSFEHKAFSKTLKGNNRMSLHLGILFLRTTTAVTIDGIAVANPSTAFVGTDVGELLRIDGGYFAASPYGTANVVVSGTAGITAAATTDIRWACRTWARQWLIDLETRTPDRAIQMANEWGTTVLAQSGGPGRPSSMPDLNTVLNANKHKPGMTGAVLG